MTKQHKSDPKAIEDTEGAKQHELSARESEVLRNHVSRLDERTTPRIVVSEDGKEVSVDHPNTGIGRLLLAESLGTADVDFARELLSQLIVASQEGTQIDETKLNAMVSIVANSKPRNEFDAMLATHAAIAHFAIMKTGRQMATAENMMQQESAQRMFSKLTRTFMDQMEALKRRSAVGENILALQQNVSVGEGGQAAIVTHVTPADVQSEALAASQSALSDVTAAPMPIIDERPAEPEQVVRFRRRRS